MNYPYNENHSNTMSDDDIEYFVKHDKKAYKRFKIHKFKKQTDKALAISKKVLSVLSNSILWICAVGGFVLSLISFFQDK